MYGKLPTLPAFRNSALLTQALTHTSYLNEHPEATEDNERLEFLGDAILNFLSGEFLFKQYPDVDEGNLTCRRSTLVDESQLAKFAKDLGLGDRMLLGRGADIDGARQNANLLSSTFEAIVGAYYLDTGSNIEAVRHYLEPFFASIQDGLNSPKSNINFRGKFDEWARDNLHETPEYSIVEESGLDHEKKFVIEVNIGGKIYGRGIGKSKKIAAKQAAEDALNKLEQL